MKFSLLNVPPGYSFSRISKNPQKILAYHPPLGALYLGSVLEEEGHNVEIFDLLAEKYPTETIRKIIPASDAIGITTYSSAYQETLKGGYYTYAYKETAEIAKYIKEIDSKLPIIIGGPHCTVQPKKCLDEISSADISVEGDGEHIISDLTKALQGKKDLSDISGIHYRQNNQIKKAKPAIIFEKLDEIPFPARHLIDKYNLAKNQKKHNFKPKFTTIITGRGCPFNCSFCTRNALGYRIFRKRSVENVVSEIREIDEKYDSVMIVDDTFLADVERANEILDRLIEMKLNLDIYVQGARVDTAFPELYNKMRKAGVTHLYYGLESANQDVLEFYNKQASVNQIKDAVNLGHKYGFFTVGTFILGAPIETKAHIERTIKFACSLPLDTVLFTILTYKFGSPLWEQAEKEGKLSDSDGYTVVADSKKGLGNFTRKELEVYWRKAILKFYLRPSYIAKQTLRLLNSNFNK
jgi:anaerobic magnesium-protoporphyrin IX monomethyl ester cyclase